MNWISLNFICWLVKKEFSMFVFGLISNKNSYFKLKSMCYINNSMLLKFREYNHYKYSSEYLLDIIA